MTAPEFSRPIDLDTLSEAPRPLSVEADPQERAALARRFVLIAIDQLAADLILGRAGSEIRLEGTLRASVTQACVATGVPVPATIAIPFAVLFRPQGEAPEEEIELGEADMDVVFHEGAAIDVGEAVAETLSLSLDPYPRAPDAEEVLKAAGVKDEEEAGPFGALAALKDRMKKG
jgi:uncharacterized metal-binding protein YceD (DUF177 family)